MQMMHLLTLKVCVQDFSEELDYWGLDDLHMQPCCQHTYYRAKWLLPKASLNVRNVSEKSAY